ncbi:MAG: hypothetical protein DMF86_11275 [Acidobacteria bacterium]|nr:MAG: hypothetical protein DMF86_11275 [Acidobacteriota bacterium]
MRLESIHYQPQQSVLYPQAGHRQTACIRNISAPHRSQITLSLDSAAERRVGGTGAGDGFVGSDIARDYSGHILEAREAIENTTVLV